MHELKTVTFDAETQQVVPKVPTPEMVIAGFESEPAEGFSKPEEWDAFAAMSGCQQAAHKATLCYRAMLEHAPTPAAQSAGQEAVGYRYRHSASEKWHYGPAPQNWWECRPMYDAAPVNGGERDHFGLNGEQMSALLRECLKPDEISGAQDAQHERAIELLNWFARFAEGDANPKWLRGHAFELAHYIASGSINRHIDLKPIKDAAFIEGANVSDADRGTLERIGFLKPRAADAPQVVVQPAHEQAARFAIDGAISYGMQGVNMPPERDHWLAEYWEIGRKLAALSSLAKAGGDEPDGEYHAAARAIGDIPCDDFKPEHMTVLHNAMALLDRAALSADGGDRKDAERYRWLRECGFGLPKQLDALDAAIAASTAKGDA